MIVMKFGGSSVGTAERISRCASLVERELARRPIVVVSACGKTTNALLRAARRALDGVVDVSEIDGFHRGLIEELELHLDLFSLVEELRGILTGIGLTRELTGRTTDLVMSFGERMSTRLFAAALRARGIDAVAVNAYEIGLLTTPEHGCAAPLPEAFDRLGASLAAYDGVPVVTGFLGVDAKGAITTLGRSGSDYSATIIAAAVAAKEVQIWTDVDGVMTCDPSIDPRAAGLPRLSFEEASELAYFGAKVLHKSTLVPAMTRDIPVRVLNTWNPADPGTTITGAPELTSRIAKSVAYKENVCLVSLASPRLTCAARLLAESLEAMRRHGVGIHMATTSDATVSLVTENGYDEAKLRHALQELEGLAAVKAEEKKAIICVVGEELKGRAEVLGLVFGAVARHGIKARMVSQSASETNIAFLVDNSEIEPAVKALHAVLLDDRHAARS